MSRKKHPYGRDARRPYHIPWRGWCQFYRSAFTFTLAGILGGVIMLCAIVYVPIVFTVVGYSYAFELFIRVARWPFLALLVLCLLALLYRYGPCRRTAKWHWVSMGSLFATTVWLLAFAVFSLCVSNFAHYDRTYGSLGAVITVCGKNQDGRFPGARGLRDLWHGWRNYRAASSRSPRRSGLQILNDFAAI